MHELDSSLGKIARGAGIAVIGMVVGLLFQFIARLIIARYGLEANYGTFSLALVILNLAVVLAGLGLYQGATRSIAFFRGRGDTVKVRRTISASLQLAIVTSLIIGIAIFFSAEPIAIGIFHTPDLASALRIFAIGIPLFTLINVISAIFRGFDRVEPQVFFQFVLLNILFLLFLAIFLSIGLPFTAVFYAYLVALFLTLVALVYYTTKKSPHLAKFTGFRDGSYIRKELLIFSLPLLGVVVLNRVMGWTDTLMLGYFKTSEVVGLYNAAYPLAEFVSTPLNALVLIYAPVAAGLYAQNLESELRRSYIIVVKWLTFLTMPIFLVLCFFPEAALNLFFGSTYIAAAPALRILSIGFIVSSLLGPNSVTLIALGKSGFIMWSSLAGAAISIAVNIGLIPPFGIVGAAIASAVSLTLVNIIRSVKLYSLSRVQPLSKNLLKPLIASVALALLFKFVAGGFINVAWWMLPVLFILYYAIYVIATVVTRSFDREDIALLLKIETKSGANLTPLKKLMRRFL
ncbi:MAG: flippase [Dehalococcoidia bacterium]|nr:flippase [Dehalococcoidia bacterium]